MVKYYIKSMPAWSYLIVTILWVSIINCIPHLGLYFRLCKVTTMRDEDLFLGNLIPEHTLLSPALTACITRVCYPAQMSRRVINKVWGWEGQRLRYTKIKSQSIQGCVEIHYKLLILWFALFKIILEASVHKFQWYFMRSSWVKAVGTSAF